MTRPLDDLRILDFSHMLSGPLGTYQLHLLGAEVIKVEPVGQGDVMRWGPDAEPGIKVAPAFVGANAGKKSVSIDLKHPRGRQVALELIRSADVVVENFRPGVMTRLGLGYDDALRINPRIIYCSVSGYGQSGPMRDWPAYDHVVQAVTGMTMLSGDGSVPVRVGFPLIDAATGMAATTAILAALLRRKNGGGSQYIDLPMIGAAANLMFSMLSGYLGTGKVPVPRGNQGFTGSPGAGTFATGQGWIALGANTPAQFENLCRLIGIDDLLRNAALIEPSHGDQGFVRARDADAVRDQLEAGLRKHPASHWEPLLNAAGIPAARVRHVGEFADEILRRSPSAMLSLPEMPGYPRGMDALNIGFHTLHDPCGTDTVSPALGQHTEEVLRTCGLSAEHIRELQAAGVVGGETLTCL